WVVSGVVLMFMGLASLVILAVSDQRLRGRAAEAYELQQQDFRNAVNKAQSGKGIMTPNESLRQLADEGSLFAYNYITVPPENMSILGSIEIGANGAAPVRWIKGGSYEKISYRFTPRLVAPLDMFFRPTGQKPHFGFFFPVRFLTDNREVKINV